MTLLKNHIYFIIILLIPLICKGHDEKFISDSIYALNLNKKARILYQNGFETQALDTFIASLNLRQQLYGSKDFNLASVYMGIGIVYKSLGQYDLAIKNYKLAETNYLLAKEFPFSQMANLYINTGTVYRNKLDYVKALQYFEQALSISQNKIQSTPSDIAGIYYNIAEIYYITDKYDDAINLINKNIINAYPEDQILYYELFAFIYQIKGDFKKAKLNYQSAIDLTIKLNGKNNLNAAIAYINYSNFLILIDEYIDAELTINKAFIIIETLNFVDGRILSELYKTKGLLLNNKPISSENHEIFRSQKSQNLQNAIIWFKKGLVSLNFKAAPFSDNSLESVKISSLIDCITLLKLIADNYYEISNLERTSENNILNNVLEQSIDYYQKVGTLIQKARKEISDDESKVQLTSLEYDTFKKIIEVSYNAYSLTKEHKYIELAFQNAERTKSSSIFDKISDQLALENSLVPDSLLNREKQLNSTISIFTEKLYNEENNQKPDSSIINDYNTQIFNAKREREELNRYMESEFKDFYELKYSNSMLSLNEIQQKIKNNQTILEYVLNESDTISDLYTFTISTDKIGFYKQKVDTGFINSLENIFHFMSNKEYLFTKNEDSKQFCISSNTLYNNLIFPFKNDIKNNKIVVVPDGKLSYIPFDALLESLPDTSNMIEFNDLNYLIRSYCINYSNSANLLFAKSTSDIRAKIKTLAFAPFYREGENIEIAQKRYPLIPLPGIEKEVARISKIVNTSVFEGEEATEENFRNYVENYDILHLAMHAFINDSLPAFSSFAFTQKKTDNPLYDGLLNTSDIYNLKLHARLAVLSACNTGTGQLKKGEGIMSLARGFLYAGCPSIIMSLWEVEDESATKIMTSFYKNLKKGKGKDESLRLAKLEYLESVSSRNAHPHYWLGFVSIGDNTPLFMSYDFYFFLLLILALLGIGIDQTIRIRKARKKRAF